MQICLYSSVLSITDVVDSQHTFEYIQNCQLPDSLMHCEGTSKNHYLRSYLHNEIGYFLK